MQPTRDASAPVGALVGTLVVGVLVVGASVVGELVGPAVCFKVQAELHAGPHVMDPTTPA